MASPTTSQLLTTTLENRHTKIADNVSNSNMLLSLLKKKNRIRTVSGGDSIICPLVYDEETFAWYEGLDTLSRTEKETISQAKYEPAMAVASITLSGEDLAKNQGKEAIFRLLGSKLENAERTLENQIGTGVYGDGSISKSMVGLEAIIADDPTSGVVGGINSATYAFWRNKVEALSIASGQSLQFEDLVAAMRALYRKTTRKRDHSDLILSDSLTFEVYEAGLSQLARYSDVDTANHGFSTLKFKNTQVVYEGDDVGHPGGMYFVNADYFKFEPYKGRNFQPLDLPDSTPDVDGITKHIGFMGGLTCSNRAMQGRLTVTYA